MRIELGRDKNGKLSACLRSKRARLDLSSKGLDDEASIMLAAFFACLMRFAPIIKEFKELETHDEESLELAQGLKLYITDKARVAGYSVGVDGAFLSFKNKLYSVFELNDELEGKFED